MTEISKAEQVQRQYQAVARLTRTLAEVHEDITPSIPSMHPDMVDMIGKHSAWIMETLDDILNGMDAVTDEDADANPVFEMAHKMFPVESVEA